MTKSVTVFSCTADENAADDSNLVSGHVCWSLATVHSFAGWLASLLLPATFA